MNYSTQVSGGAVVKEGLQGLARYLWHLTMGPQLESSLTALPARSEAGLPHHQTNCSALLHLGTCHFLITKSLITGGDSPILLLSNVNQTSY